jgi:hypothetical protein
MGFLRLRKLGDGFALNLSAGRFFSRRRQVDITVHLVHGELCFAHRVAVFEHGGFH